VGVSKSEDFYVIREYINEPATAIQQNVQHVRSLVAAAVFYTQWATCMAPLSPRIYLSQTTRFDCLIQDWAIMPSPRLCRVAAFRLKEAYISWLHNSA
jgi:hypothetical protein